MRARRRVLAGAAALLAVSLALRFWGAADLSFEYGDEPIHVEAAHAAGEGRGTASTWWNPPLAYLLVDASLATLGDGPWGRRLVGLVLGGLTPLATALLGFALFPERRRAGWLAGWLLALEPLHVMLSRSTFEEVPGAFLFVSAAALVVAGVRGAARLPALLPLAGAAAGAAFATKHYYAAGIVVLLGFALRERPPDAPRAAWARHVLVSLGLVPAVAYLACFLPWFLRGHGLREVAALHLDALRAQRGTSLQSFVNAAGLATVETAPRWFVGASIAWAPIETSGPWVSYFALVRNVPAWLLVLPSAIAAAAAGVRERARGDLLVVALFAALYLPLVLVPRPIFVYSAVPVLPFALLAVGRALDRAWERRPRAAMAVAALLLATAALAYPIATSRPVPAALYAPVLRALGPAR